ncbi:MAG: hypothetical protein Q4C18_07210, partial [Eubacteriales bacterium]|nr:hypothetical protein [Eubacteriales bacterium]
QLYANQNPYRLANLSLITQIFANPNPNPTRTHTQLRGSLRNTVNFFTLTTAPYALYNESTQ